MSAWDSREMLGCAQWESVTRAHYPRLAPWHLQPHPERFWTSGWPGLAVLPALGAVLSPLGRSALAHSPYIDHYAVDPQWPLYAATDAELLACRGVGRTTLAQIRQVIPAPPG